MGRVRIRIPQVVVVVFALAFVCSAAVAQTGIPDVPIGPGPASVSRAITEVGTPSTPGTLVLSSQPVWMSLLSFARPYRAATPPAFRPRPAVLRESRGRESLAPRVSAGRAVR
jgi:hypothetical protein